MLTGARTRGIQRVAAAAVLFVGVTAAAAGRSALSVDEARARAIAWLTEGEAAPLAASPELALVGSTTSATHGPVLAFAASRTLRIEVARESGLVTGYALYAPRCWIATSTADGPRSEDDVRAEAVVRARVSIDDAERRARAFLAARYPGFAERKPELARRHLDVRDGLATYELGWIDRKGRSKVALSVDPESGTVTSCFVTWRSAP